MRSVKSFQGEFGRNNAHGAPRPSVGKGPMGKIHPAAMGFSGANRVRLPDTGSIGADPAPFVPNVGKI